MRTAERIRNAPFLSCFKAYDIGVVSDELDRRGVYIGQAYVSSFARSGRRRP
jgi:hypothetical protein